MTKTDELSGLIKELAIVNTYGKFTGIGRVASLYFDTIRKMSVDKQNPYFLHFIEGAFSKPPLPGADIKCGYSWLPYGFRPILNRMYILPRYLESLKQKILLLSDPTLCFHNSSSRKKRVVIVHDLRPFTEFELIIGERIFYDFLLRGLKDCDFYLCDSYSTKKELLKLGIDENSVSVIYPIKIERTYPEHIKTSLTRISNGVVNLTYIANDLPYKNIYFFLSLCNELKRIGSPLDFHFNLISPNLSKTNQKFIIKHKLTNLTHVKLVNNIKRIYEQTDILLYPSLYEGFGLTVIEAMCHGIPVIANEIDVMKEIISSNGILCPANSTTAWLNAIENITRVQTYKKNAKLSIERSAAFSGDVFDSSVLNALVHIPV